MRILLCLVLFCFLPAALFAGICQTYSPKKHRTFYEDVKEVRVIQSFFQFVLPVPVAPTQPPVRGASEEGPPLVLEASTPSTLDPSLLKANCAGCHQAGVKTSKGVQLFDRAGNYAPNRSWDVIAEQITSGAMPPGSPLANDVKKSLLKSLLR